MKMPGGGPFALAPGQFTDDSELAMCLLNGLVQGKKGVFKKDEVARFYGKWITSKPFDIGQTTRTALGCLQFNPVYEAAKEAAAQSNSRSLSNGGLMRLTPLAVWASNIDDVDRHFNLIAMEQMMTHPN